MNVSLQGARSSPSRRDWDAIEAHNQRAAALPRRVFFVVLVGFLGYMAWSYFFAA